MADLKVVPKKSDGNDEWTLTKACAEGGTYPLAGHDVTVLKILEERDTCNLARVSVGEALVMSRDAKEGDILFPALRFNGEFRR